MQFVLYLEYITYLTWDQHGFYLYIANVFIFKMQLNYIHAYQRCVSAGNLVTI